MIKKILAKRNDRLSYTYVFLFAWVLFSTSTSAAHAATLSLSPISAEVTAGNIVSVKVLVSTDGASINTAAATLQFPANLLKVISVNENSSIFSLWVQNPTFSNSDGVVTFTGGVPNPGFNGQNGQIVNVVFRALKPGSAPLTFSDSSVLQNDGLGTDVLSSTQSSSIIIDPAVQTQPIQTVAPASNPSIETPVITSLTDPSQTAWYSNTSASFNWTAPANVTSVQSILSKDPKALPTTTYDSSVSQQTVSVATDGIWYFNLRYLNASGQGPVASYKVQIDSTPPNPFTPNVSTQGVQNIVALNATDAMSGISSYSLTIDNKPPLFVENSSLVNDNYILPTQNAGEHTLVVIAYDKAGNSTQASTTFTSPAITPPVLGTIASPINRGNSITITGSSLYSNVPVTVFIKPQVGGSAIPYTATTSSDGSFSVVTGQIQTPGSIRVWAQLAFSSSIVSPASNIQTVIVNDLFIVQASRSLIYILSFVIPAIILLLVLLFFLYYGWHKFFGLKRRLKKEVQESINSSHQSLLMFKNELNRQLKLLEKIKIERELNKKEEKIFSELQNNIEDIEAFIIKNLKKIK